MPMGGWLEHGEGRIASGGGALGAAGREQPRQRTQWGGPGAAGAGPEDASNVEP